MWLNGERPQQPLIGLQQSIFNLMRPPSIELSSKALRLLIKVTANQPYVTLEDDNMLFELKDVVAQSLSFADGYFPVFNVEASLRV
jgi:hypothetical protein